MCILSAQEIPLLDIYTEDIIKGVHNKDFIPGKCKKVKGTGKSNG